MAHTSGPWEASGAIDETGAHVFAPDPKGAVQDHDLLTVADLILNPSDAALIAAAPELYDEARRLRKLLDDLERACIQATERGAMMVHIGDLRQITKAPALDAAIAKAEGR